MATQTIEFAAASGQTVTAKLFTAASDTQIDSQSATEATNRKGVYTVAFSDLVAGVYRLIGFNASNVVLCQWWVKTSAQTGTYVAYEVPIPVESNMVELVGSAQAASRILISDNNSHTIKVTGQHVGADVFGIQADAINAAALASDAVAEIKDAVFAQAIESGFSFLQAQRAQSSILAGLVAQAGTGNELFRAAGTGNSGTTRLTVTVDQDGNRTGIIYNL